MKTYNDFNEMFNASKASLNKNVFNEINDYAGGYTVDLNGVLFCVICCNDVDTLSFNDDEAFEDMGLDFYAQSRLEEEIDRDFYDFCVKKGYVFDDDLAYKRGGNPLTQPLSYDDGFEFAQHVEKLVKQAENNLVRR